MIHERIFLKYRKEWLLQLKKQMFVKVSVNIGE